MHEVISRDCKISVPFGDNAKYDLVLEDPDGSLHRIQCKTAWRSSADTIRFNTHSQTTRDGEYHQSTYFGKIDAFVVWYPAGEQLFWVDIDDANESKMDLRYEADIDHPSINWAEEYELDDEIPPPGA